MIATYFTQLSYIAAAALFVLSLKWLSHPATARVGLNNEFFISIEACDFAEAEIQGISSHFTYLSIYRFFESSHLVFIPFA